MDDLISGAQSLCDAYEMYYRCRSLMEKGGFALLKWASNDNELMSKIVSTEKNNFKEKCNEYEERKVLGLMWKVTDDSLSFSLGDVVKDALMHEEIPSKRSVLKVIASVFDPLGVMSPVVVLFKLVM